MARIEPIVDRFGVLYGFEVLCEAGKRGDDRGALREIIREVAPLLKGKNLFLFVNIPPSGLLCRELRKLLKRLSEEVNLVVEVLEVEPFDPFVLPDLSIPYALDDCGTGWASLKTLLRVLRSPLFRFVKIDREVFLEFLETGEGRVFFSNFLHFIRSCGKRVILEKVESEKEFLTLVFLSPSDTLFQGFFVEKEFPSLIESSKRRSNEESISLGDFGCFCRCSGSGLGSGSSEGGGKE